MRYDRPEVQDALASAYVAGALPGRARRRFEALMHTRPALRRRVDAWEDRLTPLADGIPDVAPPQRVWRAVQQRIAPERAAPRAGLWHSLAFWRPFGAVAAALALLVTAYAGYTTFGPPGQQQVAQGTTQVAPAYLAVLEDEGDQPVLVVTAYKGPWRVAVEPLRELTPYEGKVFQVWAIERDSGATRPLLQLAGSKVQSEPLSEDGWKAITTSESLAVTLEDAGSMPAAPTGPVLFRGLCLNLGGWTET